MKKFSINLLAVAAMAMFAVSCAPDNDSMADGNLTVNYAVQVIPVGDVDKGLNGASVTIQVQGETKTATVGADGIAVFPDVRPGTISGHVTANGFAGINFTATINKTNIDANTNDFVTSTVYLLATNSTLEGRIYGDYNNDGDGSTTDNGNFDVVEVYVSYNLSGYPMGAGNGMLNSVSLDVDTYGANSQSSGVFSIANLPTSANGYFSSSYWIADYVFEDNDVTYVLNIGSNNVNLNPGVTTNVGDVFAN